ncbi:motility associated factor glycosyltransferase family protein [Paenibacillus hamazuiensis]|uniref:motility associated factor glycosyltransferase family protein n=1 Tax=Paenibacillus hamazuiensis TaxID=2936508 RepID=UPI0020103807|nr:6-hydroxymethylpterin diphosphokinase MptE-like protein [Paenibacillus hamazuiensis]
MILTKNLKWLDENYPNALEKLNGRKEVDSFQIETAKNGQCTIVFSGKERPVYLHSKYNPLNEAEAFIQSFGQLNDYEHIFFYGVGLGYHIDLFLQKYPHLTFSIYEPEVEVFRHLIAQKLLSDLPVKRLRNIYIERKAEDQTEFITDFVSGVSGKTLLIALPVYELVNPTRFSNFVTQFRETLNHQLFSFSADLRFEKRWAVNSLKNLPYTLTSPNVLLDFADVFKDKPAIIVAAGPSLEEDIPIIRKIKENGMAYIFSVGSAIKALIKNGIHPDAACTYDPMPWNHMVFEDVTNQNIDSIPLFYGTSVGYETLEFYPGPLAHMITSQDTLAAYFLKRTDNRQLEGVFDAPTIAIVTLELLHRLGCNPIILAGQNLAYKGDQFYSKGIGYEYRPAGLTVEEVASAKKIKDVYGNTILTSPGFDRMRIQMEYVIKQFGINNVYNTTKGGAHIEGTTFIQIEELVKKLQDKKVNPGWFKQESKYSTEFMINRLRHLVLQKDLLKSILDSMLRLLKDLKSPQILSSSSKLDKKMAEFEGMMKVLESNAFYQTIIQPMNRLQKNLLVRALEAKAVRLEKNKVSRAKRISELSRAYFEGCLGDLDIVTPIFNEVADKLLTQHGAAV